MPLSPSVLVPSNRGRNVSSIASSEVHPSATSLAAASVSRVEIVHDISVGHLQSHSESCFRKIPIAHCSQFLLSAAKIFSSCAKVRHSEIIYP